MPTLMYVGSDVTVNLDQLLFVATELAQQTEYLKFTYRDGQWIKVATNWLTPEAMKKFLPERE